MQLINGALFLNATLLFLFVLFGVVRVISDVSENSKVYYGRFLQNGLHERHCYTSKSK